MCYKGTLSFKDEVSSTQRPVIITNIISAGGKLTLADCNYFDITIETQDPTHNGVGASTGVKQPLNESVVPIGLTDSKIAEIFSDNMPASNNDSTLTIIDPYFFAGCYDNITEYIFKLDKILQKYPTIKKIRIARDETKDCKRKKKEMSDFFQNRYVLSYAHSDDFHDRFWIIDDGQNNYKGIAVGTSLNGFAKKIFLIAPLEPTDITDILTEVNKLQFTPIQ